jgi:hypothetical protein
MQYESNKRRSSRVFIKLPVQVAGKDTDGRSFRETAETIVVNAHGCLLMLKHDVTMDAVLQLSNPETQEDQETRVVFLGSPMERGVRVGVEFLQPAPRFWGVEFPPTDWRAVTTPPSSSPAPAH